MFGVTFINQHVKHVGMTLWKGRLQFGCFSVEDRVKCRLVLSKGKIIKSRKSHWEILLAFFSTLLGGTSHEHVREFSKLNIVGF